MKIPFDWELIVHGTLRAKVIGGWVLRSFDSLVFIPDAHHSWEISDLPECRVNHLPLESFP